MHPIELEMAQRILVLDGAMATMIQPLGLTEADFRNERLGSHAVELKGNNDLLNITRPDVIKDIHLQYLYAGADIISTNTFGANRVSQDDYDVAHLVYDMNYRAAKIAKEAVWEYKRKHAGKPLFVAGSIGPTTKLASMSPDVNNPGFRAITFDLLVAAYTEQVAALTEGGIDLFLVETVTDTLNAKAALYALMKFFETRGRRYPIMLSGTITDASGRILSGQTIEAFIISVAHAPLLSIGLNCALGATELRPYVEALGKECPFYVSAHPNAGLPNQFGSYDQSAEQFSSLVTEFAANGWLNIVGGCCGTTPAHIAETAKALKGMKPRQKPASSYKTTVPDYTTARMLNGWMKSEEPIELKEIIRIISGIDNRKMFMQVQAKFNRQKNMYHPEQAMLVNASLLSRLRYLQACA